MVVLENDVEMQEAINNVVVEEVETIRMFKTLNLYNDKNEIEVSFYALVLKSDIVDDKVGQMKDFPPEPSKASSYCFIHKDGMEKVNPFCNYYLLQPL